MRTSAVACAVLAGVIAIPVSLAAGDSDGRWQLLHQDTPYAVRYYDLQNSGHPSSERIEVWTKTVPTDKGNARIREIDSLWEFDCARTLFRNIQTKVVYINGDAEESHAPYEWSTARQELWIGTLYEIACEKHKKRPQRHAQ